MYYCTCGCAGEERLRGRSLTRWYVCLCGEKTLLNFVPIMPLCATTYIDGTRSVLWKITDTSSNFSDCLPISICRPFLYKKYEYVFEICFEIVEETCYKCPKNIYMEQYSFREREREKKRTQWGIVYPGFNFTTLLLSPRFKGIVSIFIQTRLLMSQKDPIQLDSWDC